MGNQFGAFFQQLRLAQRKTLRQFCLCNHFDPGNVSKIERGLMAPPDSDKSLRKYAEALGLKEHSPDWSRFFSLAAIAKGKIPESVIANKEVMRQLPVLFMALGKKKPLVSKLKEIIKVVKES